MKTKIKTTIISLLLGGSILLPALADTVTVDSVLNASAQIKTLSCFVYAESTASRRKSNIEYMFNFKRDGEKMRIEYVSPRNMKGTKIAVDGTYFYSYMPNMNRTIKKRINPGSTKNPGKDMGVFFYFVKGNLRDEISGMDVIYRGNEKIKVAKEKGSETVNSEHFSFKKGKEREEVWFSSESLVPVKLEIYNGRKLELKMMISGIRLNRYLSDSIFSLK